MGQMVFYLLALIALAVCFHGFHRRWRLWRQGQPLDPIKDWPRRLRAVWEQVAEQRRTRRRKYAGWMHAGIFFGMFVLFLGTCIVAVEHYGALVLGDHWLYKGWFYLACKITLDLFGLALLIGTGMALGRRYLAKPRNLGHQEKDGDFLFLLFMATLTGFLLEGAGIAADPNRAAWALFSPVGGATSLAFHGISPLVYSILWWVHMPFVLLVIAMLPYGRWLHLFTIPPTVALQPDRPMGALPPVSIAQVEQTGRIGLAEIADLSRWELMSLDACMECGRCTDACPANAVGKELNPKNIILDLRRAMSAPSDDNPKSAIRNPQSTDIISDESLWACTNCHACVRECPALIRHVDIIDGIRRFRVAEGRLKGSGATTLRQLGSRENPWGLPNAQRMDWAKDLDIPPAAPDDGREVLLWVGCAGAFDPRAQKTVRALAQLLQKAGVKFTVLGPKERCTGDPARRMGDDLLFQQLAQTNIDTFARNNVTTIVTQCPHCFHTMKNEYPQLGGNYEVLHHTQYLEKLVSDGRLQLPPNFADSVTYHDPCFLARVNGEHKAPRKLFKSVLEIPLKEPERRNCQTFCCGAGGGRMWMEEEPDKRPGVNRAKELIATGAQTVATGCPFCKIMVGDSVAQVAGESAPPVRDIAEILLDTLNVNGVLPAKDAKRREKGEGS